MVYPSVVRNNKVVKCITKSILILPFLLYLGPPGGVFRSRLPLKIFHECHMTENLS